MIGKKFCAICHGAKGDTGKWLEFYDERSNNALAASIGFGPSRRIGWDQGVCSPECARAVLDKWLTTWTLQGRTTWEEKS
jgi:hypothetical protein